jgi:uncharacterized lipoprotein YbaY
MNIRFFTLTFVLLISTATAFAQTSWLDRPLNTNWNNGNGVVPQAPRMLAPIDTRCREQIRNPESLSDRAVTRAGWSLFGASQTYGAVTIVNGMASVDGMCRPTQYNTFVFVNNQFTGTLSPTPMDSRTDGSLREANLNSPTSITAEFNRYTSTDALCCPSQTSAVSYNVPTGSRSAIKAATVDTNAVCQDQGGVETQDNVISGTVTYRQRSSLPATAVLIVKLVDVSRQDVSSTIISEQRIETSGKQLPFSFDLVYDRSKIQERNRYAIQAEIRDGERLLYITDTSNPVLTQGNPRVVDVVVVPVRGGGQGGGQGGGNRDRTLRGTVSYSQRIALANNSIVSIKLVEMTSQNTTGEIIAETTVNTNGRQVPISFELPYENSRINFQRSYALDADISTDGKITFKTEQPQVVQLRGNQAGNIQLVLVQAGATTITGKTLSLSKFGTGSIKIGDRAAQFLIRGSVTVGTNGNAQVTVSSLDGSTSFSGKLTYFDETTLRITVEGSGDADASGEIEIKYSGRRLNSISASNLVLDGQDVTLKL